MQRRHLLLTTLATASLWLTACTTGPTDGGWTTLIDGDKGLENWNRIGDANWRAEGGAIVADKGKAGYLVSKQSLQGFRDPCRVLGRDRHQQRHLPPRCPIRRTSAPTTAYEVNIWDIRPDPTYGTGGIVDFATVPVPPFTRPAASGTPTRSSPQGTVVTVKLNGAVTVSTQQQQVRQRAVRAAVRPRRQRRRRAAPSSGARCRSRPFEPARRQLRWWLGCSAVAAAGQRWRRRMRTDTRSCARWLRTTRGRTWR